MFFRQEEERNINHHGSSWKVGEEGSRRASTFMKENEKSKDMKVNKRVIKVAEALTASSSRIRPKELVAR